MPKQASIGGMRVALRDEMLELAARVEALEAHRPIPLSPVEDRPHEVLHQPVPSESFWVHSYGCLSCHAKITLISDGPPDFGHPFPCMVCGKTADLMESHEREELC